MKRVDKILILLVVGLGLGLILLLGAIGLMYAQKLVELLNEQLGVTA